MIDFKLKLILTILSSILFSLIFIILALVLPTGSNESGTIKKKATQTKFQKMSKGIREGFHK